MLSTIQRRISRHAILLHRAISTQRLITINDRNGTREIILNHEKTKNSLSLDMMNHLIEAINENKDDISLRAIILSAKGNVFSAGHNLKELQSSAGVEHHKLIFNKATELMKSIVLNPVPVIAKVTDVWNVQQPASINLRHEGVKHHVPVISPAPTPFQTEIQTCCFTAEIGMAMSFGSVKNVNGFAAAAGCQLVATCDMTVCSDISKFSTPGANFGVFCSTPGIAIGRSVPKARATYMLFTGEPLTAKEAYESGLVTKLVPATELDSEVEIIVDKIKLKSRNVISLGKQFFYKQIDQGLFDAYKLGEDVMVENINTNDGQEGIRSFVEKRKADWSHT